METLVISSLIRVTAMMAVVLIVHRLIAARSAALRHRLLMLGLLAFPMVVAAAVVPPWITLQKPAAWTKPNAIAESTSAADVRPMVADEMFATDAPAASLNEHQPIMPTETVAWTDADVSADAAVVNVPASAEPITPVRVTWSWQSLLATVWIAGSLFFFARILAAWWLARAQLSRTRPASDDEVYRFGELAPRGVDANVDFRIAMQPGQMPICMKLWGRGSVIVLPAESVGWTNHRIKAVVNHELAHAIRGDMWINLAGELQRAVLWFHPLVGMLNQHLRRDAEIACDDWAIAQGVPPREYARALLDLAARFRSRSLVWCVPMAARASMLDQRIKSVLSGARGDGVTTKRDAIFMIAIAGMLALTASSAWVQLIAAPPVAEKTAALVSSDGETAASDPTIVTAVNLGNWLLLEPWLLDIADEDLPDQTSLMKLLVDRFGQQQTDQLMDTYRQHWITLSDLQAARSLGFNAVRLPFDCGLLESADRPGVLREGAFRWLDHAVSLCDEAGLGVILDLHGAPGGQSLDGPSGDASSNRLWTDDDARDRTVWLWQRIADHYKNHDAVIAYDVVNEPYGDFQQDLRASMLDLFTRLYDSIRQVDSQTLIYAPATLDGFAFYGDPCEKGWQQVGFTQHAYPGLFDGRPVAVRSHDMFLKHWVEPVDRMVDELNVPFLLGEYNVVFEDAGGAALTAWYAQEYHRRGWSTAIWTLKRLVREPSPEVNSWSLLTNAVGLNIDPRSDSYQELQAKFQQIGEVKWDSHPKYADAIAGHSSGWQWTGRDPWQELNIDGDVASPSIVRGGNWVIAAAGRDIFGTRDRFHFRCRPATDDFQAAGRVLWIDETSPWAKAGWMIRADASADAAHVTIHTTPDGQVMLCGRDRAGADSWQQVVGLGSLPVRLGIKREGDKVHFAWTDASGTSKRKSFTPAFLKDNPNTLVGVAVCSLAPGIKTTVGLDEVTFRSLRVASPSADLTDWKPPVQTLVTTDAIDATRDSQAGSSNWKNVPVANPSFETKSDDGGEDLADGWNRWGDWINRETGWMPVRTGSAIIGYHHFRIESDADSGLWQNVPVTANQPLRFRVKANADLGSSGSPAKSIELRIETPGGDGTPVVVASKTYSATDIATGDDWSTLEVTGTPSSSVARLIIRVNPADGTDVRRDGSLKLDDVEVSQPAAATGSPSRASSPKITLVNGSFEQAGKDGEAAGWSRWGSWFGRQDQWTPVRDGNAIMAYEHYQSSGGDSSGIWQDLRAPQGAKVKFSVHANIDLGKSGSQPPRHVELKLESPQPDGKTVTLAKKTFEAKHVAQGDEWSRLSIEATTLSDQVRCLIIVVPSEQGDGRDGALKLDDADVSVTLE